ncbi:MAG: DUF167 domain-containing protein [Nanoarchaeota archaeon]|nr:DUF167 domain-containing protein [Nanoarchaeota archaeon]
MKIHVKVKPSSGKQEIIKEEEGYIIKLKSVPKDGKANIELIKLLKKHFGKEVIITSGFTSRKKIIEIVD